MAYICIDNNAGNNAIHSVEAMQFISTTTSQLTLVDHVYLMPSWKRMLKLMTRFTFPHIGGLVPAIPPM